MESEVIATNPVVTPQCTDAATSQSDKRTFINILFPALLGEAACISKLHQHHVNMPELPIFTNTTPFSLFPSLPCIFTVPQGTEAFFNEVFT